MCRCRPRSARAIVMKEMADGRQQTAVREEFLGLHSTNVPLLLPSVFCRLSSTVRAWIGSILFHAVLVFFVLFWFSFSTVSNRGAPGARFATGMILHQPSGGGRQQAGESQSESQTAKHDLVTVELTQFADINLSNLPVTSALTPGPIQNVASPGGASATDLTGVLQQGGAGRGNQTGPGIGKGEATVGVFGTEGKGTKFMYVFDCSGSMDGTPLRAAKAELIQSLDSLGNSHQFNIIFFNHGWRLWAPPERGRRLPYATESDKQSAIRFVNGVTADGGTRISDHPQTGHGPLTEAINHRPDVIFFLTDGVVDEIDLNAERLRQIERLNSRGTQINVIQFGSGGFMDTQSQPLQQLAVQNHGEYRYVNVLGLR